MPVGVRRHVDNARALPTGRAESATDRNLGGLIKDNQQTVFQLTRRQKPSRFARPL
jgi:hypothetical protein